MINIDMSLDRDNNIIYDKFDLILQEIDILFDTDPGNVLGEIEFGSKFERYLWDLNVSNEEISSYVKSLIKSKTLSGSLFNIEVNTQLSMGTEQDIILVTIDITDPETEETRSTTYRL